MKTKPDKTMRNLAADLTQLFKDLKRDIHDDYRASDDPDDSLPGMQVTIGFTPANEAEGTDAKWNYQTGDNSFTGGAYGHPHWAVVYLYRRSNSRELALDAVGQLEELIAS